MPVTAYLAAVPDTIKKFCERPILITNFQANTTTTFSPWGLWGANAAVIAKLRNFYLVRGKMHLRIVMQAEPFSYGSGILYLDPANSYGGTACTFDPLTSAFAADFSVYLDFASDSQPEMVMPMIDRIQWQVAENLSGYDGMTTTYSPIVNPNSANSSSTPTVQINVYAFVTDLQVRVPQAQSAPNTSASENKPDFRISSIANKFSTAASVLSDVPVIGAFAATASTVASVIGSVASFFGFSKPLDVTAMTKVLTRRTGEMSTVDGIDPSYILSIDSKCEKSISYQSLVGTNLDQMAFAYALSHWGYINLLSWTTSQTEGTNLGAWHVSPGAVQTAASNGWIQTPLSHVALPFAKWSGSIEYKFIVVCSAYHRGRVRIYWNPQSTITDSPLNTTLCSILDIKPGASATMVVPWSGISPARPMGLVAISTAVATPTGINNGYIWVDVDQQLVCQRAAANVSIVVLVRAGPDFCVYCPTMINLQYSSTSPYHAVAEATHAVNTQNIGTPSTYTPVAQSAVNEIAVDDKQATLFNNNEVFGETVGSFRAMVKRYCYYYSVTDAYTTASHSIYQISLDRMPGPRFSGGASRVNVGFNWMNYAGLSYYFVSGGSRVKLFLYPIANWPQSGPWVASRWKGSMSYGSATTSAITGDQAEAARAAYVDSASGCIATFSDAIVGNTVVEIQIPDQTGYKANYTDSVFIVGTNTDYTAAIQCPINGSVASQLTHTTFYAAADDFNLYLYRGPPIIYFWGTPTSA